MVDKMGAKNYQIISWNHEMHLCSGVLPIDERGKNGVL
jgi:hypothetical protein